MHTFSLCVALWQYNGKCGSVDFSSFTTHIWRSQPASTQHTHWWFLACAEHEKSARIPPHHNTSNLQYSPRWLRANHTGNWPHKAHIVSPNKLMRVDRCTLTHMRTNHLNSRIWWIEMKTHRAQCAFVTDEDDAYV